MITIDRMRYRVRKAVGIIDDNDPDLPETDIDEYLNLAFWEVQDKMPLKEKETSSVFPTIAAQRQYTIDTPVEYVYGLAIVDSVTGEHAALDQIPAAEYESQYIDDAITTGQQGRPYRYLLENDYVILWPTPNAVYNIILRRNITLTDLSDTNTATGIPRIWDEIIIYGAIWRAEFDLGNRAGSRETQRLQVAMISSITPVPVKELADSSLAGMQVLGRDYDQRYGK